MRKLFVLALLSLLALAPATAPRAATTALGDPITELTVRAWKSFSVSLGANVTTGYEWQLEKPLDTKMVRFVAKEYVADPVAPNIVGSGGHETWTFDAVKPGKTEIALKYVRPWEKDQPPAKRLLLRVRIQ